MQIGDITSIYGRGVQRGKILQTGKGGWTLVEYVDTGEQEWVPPSRVRRFPALHRFKYNPATGELRDPRGRLVGGGLYDVNGKVLCTKKIRWYLMTREWPSGEIKPKNGDGHNYRWENLECVQTLD